MSAHYTDNSRRYPKVMRDNCNWNKYSSKYFISKFCTQTQYLFHSSFNSLRAIPWITVIRVRTIANLLKFEPNPYRWGYTHEPNHKNGKIRSRPLKWAGPISFLMNLVACLYSREFEKFLFVILSKLTKFSKQLLYHYCLYR